MTGRVLGIDLGEKRIGLALSDDARRVATPLQVVARSRADRAHREAITAVVEEWGVTALVVGLPVNLDGTEGAAARRARAEAERLGEATGLEVELYDERFTTLTAERHLMEQDLDATQRREVVDMVAAAVMLQSWLDARSSSESDPSTDA